MSVLVMLLGCSGQPESPRLPDSAYTPINWDQLIPAGWDPADVFKGMDFSKLKDSDPRAIQALLHVREVWDRAPTDASLNGQLVRLSGYLTPLDTDMLHVTEFLLVPYMGACIHTPPPPANQIVHVKLAQPMSLVDWYGSVVARGRLETVVDNTALGVSAYRMTATRIEPFTFDNH